MKSHQLELKAKCPGCRKVLDGATAVDGEGSPSRDGSSFSVCIYCTTLLVFTKTGYRRLSQREYVQLPEDLKTVLGNAVYLIRKKLKAN